TKTVGLLTKPVPLIPIVCTLFDPVTGFGETLVIVGGPAAGATTWKPAVFDACPFGLVSFAVQLSALVCVTIDICTCVLLTNVTSPELFLYTPLFRSTKTVGLLTKPVPLIPIVCTLFDPVTGFGETLVMVGGPAAGATTWKPA